VKKASPISLVKEVEDMSFEEMEPPRHLDTAFSNIYLRLCIWQDMLDELFKEKAVLGVSFGMPQRSISLEKIGWANSVLKRDGWITPHNSFLHWIYRGGVVGIVLVVLTLLVIFRITWEFITHKTLIGVLLMAIFVYWITIANFIIFLEFPYLAIPFWSLLGLTLAYCNEQFQKPLLT